MIRKVLVIILFSLGVFATSCTHAPVNRAEINQRCVANADAKCATVFGAPELDSAQTSLKDQLLLLTNDKTTQRQIIKTIDSLLPTIARLSAENKLKPVLTILGQKLLETGKLPDRFNKDNLAESIELLATMIENQFIAKNFNQKSKHKYVSWLEASRKIQNAARKTAVPPPVDQAFRRPLKIQHF